MKRHSLGFKIFGSVVMIIGFPIAVLIFGICDLEMG